MHGKGLPPDDPLKTFKGKWSDVGFKGDTLAEALDEIIESWPKWDWVRHEVKHG